MSSAVFYFMMYWYLVRRIWYLIIVSIQVTNDRPPSENRRNRRTDGFRAAENSHRTLNKAALLLLLLLLLYLVCVSWFVCTDVQQYRIIVTMKITQSLIRNSSYDEQCVRLWEILDDIFPKSPVSLCLPPFLFKTIDLEIRPMGCVYFVRVYGMLRFFGTPSCEHGLSILEVTSCENINNDDNTTVSAAVHIS